MSTTGNCRLKTHMSRTCVVQSCDLAAPKYSTMKAVHSLQVHSSQMNSSQASVLGESRLVVKSIREKLRRTGMGLTPSKSSSGLTLIECLVAISVIGVTTASIGPMMVFSVATRVQNQKADQALQLAQSEIDKVRLIVEVGGDYRDKLDAVPLPSTTSTNIIRAVPPPTAFSAVPSNITAATIARKVDLDADGDYDYAVQLFRTEGVSVGSTPMAFDVGVRVYDVSRAESNLGNLLPNPAGLTFTSGEGQRGRQPLAVLYSQIVQGDRSGSLCQHWALLSVAGSAPASLICPAP